MDTLGHLATSAGGRHRESRQWTDVSYLDVNRFATRTVWAHGVLAFLARPYSLAILAVLFVVALAGARLGAFGGSDIDQIAALVWAAIGTAAAYAVSLPVVHLVARARPFVAMPTALVLVPRPRGFSFPNEHAVIAGAVAAGFWLSRARILAALATLVAIVLGFAVVYAGVAYPGDALAGLLLGALVSLALYPLAIGSLRDLAHTGRAFARQVPRRRAAGVPPSVRGRPRGRSSSARAGPCASSRPTKWASGDRPSLRGPAPYASFLRPTRTELTFCLPTTPGESASFPQVSTGSGSGASTAQG